MHYTVRLHGIAVGHSDLERPDPAERFARGAFRPASGYQLVQDVFGLYAEAVPKDGGAVADPEALQRYYRAREALGLELVDGQKRVVPDTTIHLYDNHTRGNLELEIHTADPLFWKSLDQPRDEPIPPNH